MEALSGSAGRSPAAETSAGSCGLLYGTAAAAAVGPSPAAEGPAPPAAVAAAAEHSACDPWLATAKASGTVTRGMERKEKNVAVKWAAMAAGMGAVAGPGDPWVGGASPAALGPGPGPGQTTTC